jgi:Transcriptional regulator, AbiEi antitoxin/Protein of unknown function (DUF559)
MPRVHEILPAYDAKPHAVDLRLAELAARQQGVVATWQLAELSLTASAIHRRIQAGRLHRIFTGVYAVGHKRLPPNGRWMAAVLACGPDAVLSHRTAAALWELRPRPSGPVDVTVPASGRRSRTGIRLHNVRSLHADDRTDVDGIPVTSPARTLLDYAETNRQQLRLAIEAADRRELYNGKALDALLHRSPGRGGRARLRAVLAEIQGPAPWTRSELERRFLALIRAAGVPEPQANVLVAGFLVDLFWSDPGLVVELDGFEFHKTRTAFESDRRRDAKLQLAGHPVIRITQRRIENAPRDVVRDVVGMLRRR